MASVNLCMSPTTLERSLSSASTSTRVSASPNPIEMNSAAKLNDFGNQMEELQQKIDLLQAKTTVKPLITTPPPIQETGDVEKDFETVFDFNVKEKGEVQQKAPTVEKVKKVETEVILVPAPPPPLPKSAPPIVPDKPAISPCPPAIKKQISITSVNTLKPWQKQHEYRPMSVVLKDKSQEDPLKTIQFNFKPIGAVASNEDMSKDTKETLIAPLPIYSSQSVQDLLDVSSDDHRKHNQVHGSLDNLFMSKSSDDLIMRDIDGIQGIRSHKYKKHRHAIRPSMSCDGLIKESSVNEEEIYQNLEKIREEVKQLKLEAISDMDRRKTEMEIVLRPVVKKPVPLPRVGSENELNRSSKTLSFVFDPKSNEFVLEEEKVKQLPNVDRIERNSALLQQRSSSTSNIVPIHVSSPRKTGPAYVKSMESLDFTRETPQGSNNSLNEKGNFFSFKFFKKDKEVTAKVEPPRQSIFYGDPVDWISMDMEKYEAKLVHIEDDEEEEAKHDQKKAKPTEEQHQYEVVTVNDTFNRSLSTFGQQTSVTESSSKFQ